MKKFSLALLLCVPFVLAQAPELKQDDPQPQVQQDQPEPPMLGIHWARGFNPTTRTAQGGKGSNANMSYHGGKIMTTAVNQSIFWGTSWPTYSGDKMTGMDAWYSGFNGSNYAKTSDEYTGTNGQVGAATSYIGHLIDGTAASGGGSTS